LFYVEDILSFVNIIVQWSGSLETLCHFNNIRMYVCMYVCILTVVLSRVVSEIFNVEKCRDLEIGVRGHSTSLKVVPYDRLCMVSY